MICTVANYEYAFYWYFYQDGRAELEIKLTGMLNSYLLADNESPAPHGTAVAPRVNAQYHQHLFSLRLDPMIDGLHNSIVETDIVPSPYPTSSPENFAGNAFMAQSTTISAPSSGGRTYNATTDRRWTIVNPSRKHYCSGHNTGYQLEVKGGIQNVLAREDSWIVRRAPFTTKHLWVVKDKEGERNWPAGKYVPQTRNAPADSVIEWTKDEGTLENEDLLLFLTVGVNHLPRPEDWPVMPVEHLRVGFKPVSFFKQNPSLDVPGDKDSVSSNAFEGTNGACCN
jgi:primary-amine oxidase